MARKPKTLCRGRPGELLGCVVDVGHGACYREGFKGAADRLGTACVDPPAPLLYHLSTHPPHPTHLPTHLFSQIYNSMTILARPHATFKDLHKLLLKCWMDCGCGHLWGFCRLAPPAPGPWPKGRARVRVRCMHGLAAWPGRLWCNRGAERLSSHAVGSFHPSPLPLSPAEH